MSNAVCPGCEEDVTNEHTTAIQCDSLDGTTENHWWHRRCLQAAHLLDGEEVTIQGALVDMLTDYSIQFKFMCHLCGAQRREELPPLPVQLVEQGVMRYEELEAYGALTPNVKKRLGNDPEARDGLLSEATGVEVLVPPVLEDKQASHLERPSGLSDVDAESNPFPENPAITRHIQRIQAQQKNTLGIIEMQGDEELNPPPSPGAQPLGSTKQKSNVVGQSRFFGDPMVKKPGGELGQPVQNQQLQVPRAEGGIAPTLDPNNPMFQLVQLFTSQQAQLISDLERQRSDDARNRYEQELQRADRLEQQRREDETRREERQAQQRKEDREFFVKLLGETRQPSGSSDNSSRTNPPTSNTSSGFAKPPKLEVPSFDGDIYQWPSFWDQFTQLIENSPKLSPVEKLGILLGKLQGAAKDAVKNYTLEAGNYQIVLEELKERYDDKDKIKRAYLDKLSNIAPVSKTSAVQLQKFSDEINSIARVLIPLVDDEQTLDMQCMTMMPLLFEKIPVLFRSQLLTAKGKNVCTHLSIFRSAIREQVKFQELVLGDKIHGSSTDVHRSGGGGGGPRPPSKGTGASLVGAQPPKTPPQPPKTPQPPREKYCIFCEVSGQHRNFECPVYKTLDERRKKLGARCYICLKEGHFTSGCPTKGRFKCITCKSVYHNSCLCPKSFKKTQNTESAGVVGEVQSSLLSGDTTSEEVTEEEDEPVAMQTVITKVRNSKTKNEFTANIMYDTGCKKTYIDQKFATLLNLKARVRRYRKVSTFNCKESRKMLAGITDIEVLGKDGVYVSLIGNIVDKITTRVHMDGFSLSPKDKKLVKDIPMADSQFNVSRPFDIDILIGNDYYPMLLDMGKIQLGKSGVYLLETKLGWVASGIIKEAARLSGASNSTISESLALFVDENLPIVLEDDSSSSVEDLWKFETLGIKDPQGSSEDDHIALQQFKNTVKFEEGRVSVQWLKRPGIEKLPSNFTAALLRLKSLLKALAKNDEYRKKYNQYFCDLLERLIIQKVFKEAKRQGFQIHYIPHQAVITPLHNTTKMRIVFDAGAATSLDGKSLNDYLYRGPNLLVDLGGLLLRFRLWLIAIISDIEKAFLQVALQESKRDLTRFLWLKDPTKLTLEDNVQVYRFCRVPFGFKPSPFLLGASVGNLLDRASESQREIAEQVRENIYVDNVITGANSVEEAKDFYAVAKSLLAEGSMNLREWNSNSTALMDFIPEKDRDSRAVAKVLGLQWDKSEDTISVNMKEISAFREAKTKREILSCLASIFDPLGIFCCLKIQGIIFLQSLWKEKITWDAQVSEPTLERWSELCEIFELIPDIKIPHLVCDITPNSVLQLHCFCDASQEAFSTTHYLRVQTESGEVRANLVFAKARVCPVSGLSVPRAELLGTLIGTRSITYLKKQMGLSFDQIHLWTDSQCVLGWIKNESKDQGVFVTNRVMEILSTQDVFVNYVSTEQNPADLATKTRAKNFKIPWKFWFEGPEWLKLPQEMWPELPIGGDVSTILLAGGSNHDLKETSTLNLEEVLSVEAFSSFLKLVRVTGWMLRFVKNLKKRVQAQKLSHDGIQTRSKTRAQSKIQNQNQLHKISDVLCLGKNELWEAQCLWLESVQRSAFPALFTEKIHTDKLALNLKLNLSEDNVLRCEGRLGESDLTHDAKYPILLPRSSPLTYLIVHSFHRQFLHSGVNQTLASVRSRFWIPQGRKVVGSVLKHCMHCKRFHAKPFAPPRMPNLPKERVSQVPPFTFTGADYFGPMFYKSDQGEKKAWVLLLTCFTVRAIHLEVVVDMSAESLLCALRRFVARRGRPSTIFSDNAKQFKLTDKILQQADKMSTVRDFLDEEGINWKFIPELSPWMGAAWERLIGVTKTSLKKSLGRTVLNFEQLRTIMTEVEDVVNSGPITFVSMNLSDADAVILTPQKFLSTGRPERLPIVPSDDPDDLEYVKNQNTQSKIVQSWRIGQHYLDRFWNSWHKNYLSNLRERHCVDKFPKVKSEVFRCPRVGEVVLVKQVDMPRGLWKLGRVVELHEGRDSLVRSAKVKTSGSREVITRPVSLLYPLEIQSFDEPETSEPESAVFGCAPDFEVEYDLTSQGGCSQASAVHLDSGRPWEKSAKESKSVTVKAVREPDSGSDVRYNPEAKRRAVCSSCSLLVLVLLVALSFLPPACSREVTPSSDSSSTHNKTFLFLLPAFRRWGMSEEWELDLHASQEDLEDLDQESAQSRKEDRRRKGRMRPFNLSSGKKVGGKRRAEQTCRKSRLESPPHHHGSTSSKKGSDPIVQFGGKTYKECRHCRKPRPVWASTCFCQMKNKRRGNHSPRAQGSHARPPRSPRSNNHRGPSSDRRPSSPPSHSLSKRRVSSRSPRPHHSSSSTGRRQETEKRSSKPRKGAAKSEGSGAPELRIEFDGGKFTVDIK